MNIYSIENNLINISFGLSLLGLILYWWTLTVSSSNNYLDYTSRALSIVLNMTIASSLIIRWIENKYFPLSNLYESLIFLAWSMNFIQIFIEQKVKNKFIGSITMPTVLFIIGFTTLYLPNQLKEASPLVPALKSNWLMMHVTVMILSYSTLMIGSLLSFLMLIISNNETIKLEGNSNNNIKKILFKYQIEKQDTITQENTCTRLSLVQIIDNLSYRIIGFGFPLLTIGIISGAVWANAAWGTYWSWDPKETWALITWITFAIYLHSRINSKSKSRRPAIIASLGFIVIWICYLGVNFLGKGLHSYGWLIT
uniref:Cytochrome c biogenesis protein CcsA n=1 Tax=Polysiphonia sertularioides TaxID=945028 RepID=A0A1Z1M8Y6_9FLOR|nr:cytochrome c biogenesis protein ccs1 [Polysiphonia sertularioides]ARW62446.1 cytochrome c biogenesis protein ccs1 [Polysiphonia sertularioides]